MIAALFLNPAFLLVAAALVSVPIIIHLINRMRFKRIRWAAMEFLLKAQKRTRRRLIIEQLILLALRCTLIALLGLLVLQFVGCGEGNLGGKPNIHIAILDDTLSMQDACWKNPDGTPKTCFDVAKKDFLVKKIGKGLAASKTNDQLIVLVLSRVGEPGYEPKAYQNLNDSNKFKEFESEINELQPSAMHVDMTHGIKAAAKIIGEKAQNRASLHILSDYRHIDWSGKNGEKLTNELLELVRANKEMKIRPIDTVSPPRAAAQGGYPPSRDNVGITEIRPDARIVGHKIPVRFTVSIHNFSGKQVEAELAVRNEVTGNDLLEVNPYIRPKNPIKLPPNETTTVVFDYGSTREGQQTFFKDHELKDGAAKFAHLSVRLTNAQKLPLENDGLLEDNTRHVVVEVREQVPILVVDGNGANSRSKKDLQLREMNDTKDSYILERALGSVPGASYKVVFGDELPGCSGDATKALERLDLNQYPTIYIVNVQTLKPKQISNLESYVREGGGVAFYMGPLVNAKEYNEKLYRKGEGVFPVPLKTPYYPAFGEPEIPTKKDNDTFELLTREDLYGGQLQNLPIFSEIFETPAMREPLGNLPIHRYFKVDGNLRVGKAKELATLPNDQAATSFDERAVTITKNGQNVIAVLANPEFKKYRAQLDKHMMEIREKARPQAGAPVKAY
ncbi:MAG: BatA domain-containing protein, partial [Planctomycetes bacterium]|nr:BatA domain-containing protein [Planctomycetota bacterium]